MSWISVGVGLALAAGGAAVSYNETKKVERNQDNALSQSIIGQARLQREADTKVNDQVVKLETSRSGDEREKRNQAYMDTLRASRSKLTGGLTPTIGSEAFRADAAVDAADVQQYGADTANLLSGIDAAGLQRQGEGFGFGNLATDLSLIGRQSNGLSFLDDLRLKRASQRNAGKDALAALLSGAGSAAVGSGGTGASAMPANSGIGGSGTGYIGRGGI